GPAVGQQVDDADAGQGDQRLADGRVADAEALGHVLGDEVGAGAEPALEDVGQEGLDDRLPAQAVIPPQRAGATRDRHRVPPTTEAAKLAPPGSRPGQAAEPRYKAVPTRGSEGQVRQGCRDRPRTYSGRSKDYPSRGPGGWQVDSTEWSRASTESGV